MSTTNNFNLPVPTKADSVTLSQAINSSGSTFKLLYFNIHARGHILRLILTLSGAKWEEINAVWPDMAEKTPFRCLPVVYETTSDGAITLELKFNLVGKNEYESLKVDQFCTSTETTNIQLTQKVHRPPRETQLTVEERIVETNKFYKDTLGKFITLHEAHLQQNGSNGHYVGDNFTLADLKTTVFIERVLSLTPKSVNEVSFSEERSPNLWKVRQAVYDNPNVKAWLNSQRYQELDANTKALFRV
ncbi:hypothetical protein BGX21_004184 [Mortierella sp. AD011]|nr:hypothetical protein BGX20_004286 [Mortierella sp. AD010]KAF9374239.1 hypothetical protein BGX21_004184 [Mortierella sp. AD011]